MDTSNPYRPNEPVTDATMLFGRQDAIDWLERQLNNNARTLIIKGTPLVGKTSLIRQVEAYQQVKAFNLVIALYSPEALENTARSSSNQGNGLDVVLRHCVEQCATQLRLLNLLSIEQLNLSTSPSTALRELLTQASHNLGQAHLVAYFDDLHHLITDDMTLVASFLSILMPILDDCPQLHCVFTIDNNQLRRIRHPLIDRVPTLSLGPLATDASVSMITLPVRNTLRFDYGVTRRIAETNSHHPYYLTLFCHILLNRQMYDGWVNQRDFEVVLDEVLTSPIIPFNEAWSQINWSERAVLTGMAAIQGKHGPMTSQEIIRFLQKIQPSIPAIGVEQALNALADQGILVPMGHISYRFHVELFRFWLRKNADIYQVLNRANWTSKAPPKAEPTSSASSTKAASTSRRLKRLPITPQFLRLMGIVGTLLACLLITFTVFFIQYLNIPVVALLFPPTPTASLLELPSDSDSLSSDSDITPTASPSPAPTVPPTQTPVPVQVRTLPALAYMAREVEEGWRIYTMNADGSEVVPLSAEGVDDRGPVWSPFGDKIAYISLQDGNREIYVMDSDGRNKINLTRNIADDWTPAWSPDGRQLAFASIRTGRWEVYLMDMACLKEPDTCPTRIRQLTNDGNNNLSPVWSPDGNRLAYNSRINGNWDIFTMALNGTDIQQITFDEANELAPAWSPNGALFAYESDKTGDVDIYVIGATGGTPQNISNYPLANDHGPTWSPDSQQVVYYSNREGNWDIFTISLGSGNPVNLTNTATRDEQTPSWRP